MDFNAGNATTLLKQFDFANLFIDELGWDRYNAGLSVAITGTTFALKAVAEKRGMVAWVCQAPAGQKIPDRATRKKIETQVAKTTLEHLIIFTDTKRGEQIWCWARREAGKPASVPEHFWYASSGNRGFLQKLEAIAFSLAEENTLTLVDVTTRARAAFDVERVTKRFYDQFKAEHKAFLDFISGITELADKEWYASLMLNRMMFIYFMQRKGFMNAERDYLRDRLSRCQKEKGKDKFYSFYRYFLLRLFHEGLGGKARDTELDKLLGRIPYLNGGLFEKHPIEERCPDIKIPDEAFTRIFAYFDRYQWHLDERPLRNDNEINPDVLGYIFEKYINQKQMGAYYTKEDITEYISKNTVIPFLFDAAKAKCKVAFENPGGPTIWDHLRDDPDRYIYAAVKHGAEHALPPGIAAGIEDVSARTQWNKNAPADFGLPTEIWREVVARRTRYAEVRAKLAAGEVREINDLITLNLDIRQFAQDVIERCEGPDLLRAFWKAIEGVTVLDPTCGSGAFLFAALNILEPLYETCLERMEAFVADLERSGEGHAPKKFEDFKAILAKVAAHPNARYFTLKSIILNNLFGVDIMEEAVEICKLRLFLKLAAQVDPDQKHENLGIEPLPDIDFNIRAGNTLVGYATYAEVEASAAGDWIRQQELEQIKPRAADLQQAFDAFRARQVDADGSVPIEDKIELRRRLMALEEVLNLQLAKSYGLKADQPKTHQAWLNSHQPFHWFIEFFGIMSRGGFDVVIGNPPYIELKEVQTYSARGYDCESCGNLYALVIERCGRISNGMARQGYIVPVSSVSTDRYNSLQKHLVSHDLFFSNYDDRPSRLFDGLEHIRLSIHILGTRSKSPKIHSTRYQKWFSDERANLFSLLTYTASSLTLMPKSIAKFGTDLEATIAKNLLSQKSPLATHFHRTGKNHVFYSRKVGYFLQVLNFTPRVTDGNGNPRPPSEFKQITFNNSDLAKLALACLNSNLFFWFVTVTSDCRHLNKREIETFPMQLENLARSEISSAILEAADALMNDVEANSEMKSMRFKHDTLQIQFIYPKKSKSMIDQIDHLLGDYLGLNANQIDFLVNFDAKYRMGAADHIAEDDE
jgi:hypothetical protein